MRGWILPAVIAPPLVLAAVGLTHPHHLTADSAEWWTTMHILLVPVFPLLGMALWLLLRAETGVLAWLARVAAFSYAVFYGALDAIAGIGTGALVRNGAEPGAGTRRAARRR